MNKRKSLTNSNAKKCSKKRKKLFINTDDYRNKKPSKGDISLTNDESYDIPVNSSFSLPIQSTPARAPPSDQKLNIHRKRGKTKQLSFSDDKERTSQNVTRNTSYSTIVKVSDDLQLHGKISKENFSVGTDLSAKISESDLLYSETLLNSDISGIHESKDVNSKIKEMRSKDLNNASAEDQCLNTPSNSKKHVSQKENQASFVKNQRLMSPLNQQNYDSEEIEDFLFECKEITPLKPLSNFRDESLLNILVDFDSPSVIDTSLHKKEVSGKDSSSMSNVIKDDSIFMNLELTQVITASNKNLDMKDVKTGNVDMKDMVKDGSKRSIIFTDTFYGLSAKAKEMFIRHRSISKLYDWQDECLRLNAVDKHKNLVYSLPTSGGKTLVAEILMLKELLVREKNAILVLPYVAIVQEKVRGLSPFAVDLGFHVEEYAGGKGALPPKKRRAKKTVYIATIEKANAIVNSFIETERTEELGMIVIDELHMIGEGGGRGSLLEILLTKVMFKCSDTQIVGMSATLGNMNEIQKFLKAEIYTKNFRPVELTEYIKVDNNVYKIEPNAKSEEDLLTFSRKISHPKGLNTALASRDPDHILSLVLEVIPDNSCLMFCATKKNCENAALMLAKSLPKNLMDSKKYERNILLKAIQQAIRGVCEVLSVTIPYGIAYHHSGLTTDERELIEEAYSSGVICLLCCTSTLAAGVNLPARRVILRSPYVGNRFLTRSQYKQMVGRAGRAGIDSEGESILVVQSKDRLKVLSLVDGPIPNCKSSLFYEDGKGLRQLILSLLGLKICSSETEIEQFFELTLFHIQQSNDENYHVMKCIKKEVEHLNGLGLVTNNMNKDGVGILRSTDLGKATLKGCVNIDLAPLVYEQLKRSLAALCLVNELHLLYLVTPLDLIHVVRVDWMLYYRRIDRLKEVELKACEFIGVSLNVLCKKATGQRVPKGNFDEFVYKRFYLTLIIQEILVSKSLWNVANSFNESRGFLQNLFSSTMAFMSLMIHFTEELSELWALKLLFQALSARVTNVRNAELVVLMEIPGVKQARATQLFKAGYRTLQHLAHADPKTLVREIERLSMRQANLIVSSSKMILQEKIESLREEADEIAAIPDSPIVE